jgi:hypothetical protein
LPSAELVSTAINQAGDNGNKYGYICSFLNVYEKAMWILFLCMYVFTSIDEEN